MTNTLKLAKKIFKPENIEKIEYLKYTYIKKYKIVVFTPADRADEITYAMASAGAGKIGEYSECTFRIQGTGTFKGGKKSNPFLGTKGKFEKADEVRLEMICDAGYVDSAIESMLKVHPYEEPAYEIYEVLVRTPYKDQQPVKIKLKKSITVGVLLSRINEKLDTPHLPDELSSLKLKEVILDTTDGIPYFSPNNSGNKLYLRITKNGTLNIRLN